MSSQPAAAHRASISESGTRVRSLRSLLAAIDHAGHDHHDDHAAAPECACLAASEGWPLDCTDKTAMAKALTYLEANADCKTKAHSATCEKNYNVIRAHHDHCDHDEVPEEVETEIHEFESFYTKCKIHRKYDVTIDDCAEAHCDEASELNATVTKLAENNCATGTKCQTETVCKNAYQKILMAHDTCDHDDLPTSVEKAIHDYEDACELSLCNTASKEKTALTTTCSTSGAASMPTSFLLAATGAAMILAAA
jgi:hypothetical protein